MFPDLYRSLQVDPSAEQEVVDAAYHRLARKYHPDLNPTAEAATRMRELNAAYEVLGDARRRRAYDEARRAEAAGSGAGASADPAVPRSTMTTPEPHRRAVTATPAPPTPAPAWRRRPKVLAAAATATVALGAAAWFAIGAGSGADDAAVCGELARVAGSPERYPGDTGLTAIAEIGRRVGQRQDSVLLPLFARLASAETRARQVEAGAAIFRKCAQLGVPVVAPGAEAPDSLAGRLRVALAREGIEAEVVACGSQAAKAGAPVRCDIRFDGSDATVGVEVRRSGASGEIDWTIPSGMVDVAVIRESVLRWLHENGYADAETVSCGGRWKPPVRGSTFECVARTRSGRHVTMVMQVVDGRGTVTWSVKAP